VANFSDLPLKQRLFMWHVGPVVVSIVAPPGWATVPGRQSVNVLSDGDTVADFVVEDGTPPVISLPRDQTLEATARTAPTSGRMALPLTCASERSASARLLFRV